MENNKPSALKFEGTCFLGVDSDCDQARSAPTWQGSGAYNVVNGYGKANVRHVPQFVGLVEDDDDEKRLTHLENKLPMYPTGKQSSTTSASAPLDKEDEA